MGVRVWFFWKGRWDVHSTWVGVEVSEVKSQMELRRTVYTNLPFWPWKERQMWRTVCFAFERIAA